MTARPRAVIIGMMGAGKTRVGKEVAHMLRLPFADADVEIEREVGMKIPSYFEDTVSRHSARSRPISSPICLRISTVSFRWAVALP